MGGLRLITVSKKAPSKLNKESRPSAGRWRCCTGARRRDGTSVRSRIVTIRHATSFFADFGGPFPSQDGPPEKKCHWESGLNQRDEANPGVWLKQSPVFPRQRKLDRGCASGVLLRISTTTRQSYHVCTHAAGARCEMRDASLSLSTGGPS